MIIGNVGMASVFGLFSCLEQPNSKRRLFRSMVIPTGAFNQ